IGVTQLLELVRVLLVDRLDVVLLGRGEVQAGEGYTSHARRTSASAAATSARRIRIRPAPGAVASSRVERVDSTSASGIERGTTKTGTARLSATAAALSRGNRRGTRNCEPNQCN